MTDYPLPNVSNDLSGEVALVTGATSGLGWRFARVLAAAGATVIPAGRREERLDDLAAVIEADGGVCHPVVLDVNVGGELLLYCRAKTPSESPAPSPDTASNATVALRVSILFFRVSFQFSSFVTTTCVAPKSWSNLACSSLRTTLIISTPSCLASFTIICPN